MGIHLLFRALQCSDAAMSEPNRIARKPGGTHTSVHRGTQGPYFLRRQSSGHGDEKVDA